MIIIKSKTEGFRRCGVVHTSDGQEFPDDRFTKDQLKAIENEPMLIVTHLPDPPNNKNKDEEKETRKVLEKKKLDQLKSDCDAMGIEYPADATKAVLVELILKKTAPLAEE